jgi:copper(I)-binding protein
MSRAMPDEGDRRFPGSSHRRRNPRPITGGNPMKSTTLLFVAAICLVTGSASAEDARIGSIEIIHPWSRATPKGASVGVGYATIRNAGTVSDRLIGGSIAVAARLEVHEMTMDAGVMKMRELKSGLEIKPGETAMFKPGGLHLMFVDLKMPLEKGKPVKGTLIFERAGTVEVTYDVESVGAQPAERPVR